MGHSAPHAPPVPQYSYPIDFPKEFVDFHEERPWIYAIICREARLLKAQGCRTAPIRGPFESARLSDEMKQHRANHPEKMLGLDNDWCPWYSRLIDALEPDLKGFFPMRRTGYEIQAAQEAMAAAQTILEFD